jgi:chromosome segregation ATPase
MEAGATLPAAVPDATYQQALWDLDALRVALTAANRQIEALTQELHERESGESETTSKRLAELQLQARSPRVLYAHRVTARGELVRQVERLSSSSRASHDDFATRLAAESESKRVLSMRVDELSDELDREKALVTRLRREVAEANAKLQVTPAHRCAMASGNKRKCCVQIADENLTFHKAELEQRVNPSRVWHRDALLL